MKKFYVLIVFLLLSFVMPAQYLWDYGGELGIANYLGEMGGKSGTRRDFVADMKLAETRWNTGFFVRYKFSSKLALKAELAYLRIQGADSLSTNPARHARNLNFRNDIFELSLTPQVTIYENNDLGSSYRFRTSFKFYGFAGVAVFHHNPKAYFDDEWVALQPYHTENTKYSLWQFAVPVGTGFYFTFKKKHRIGLEYNWRICFTDYLDDVSKNYVDPKTLSGDGVYLADRTHNSNINPKDYPAGFLNNFGYQPSQANPNQKRGDPKHDDTYMTLMVNYSYVIRGHSSFYRSRYGSFFFKKKRKRARKIRAKF